MGVVYDVLRRNSPNFPLKNIVGMESDKIVFGGPLEVDLTKTVQSLGEYILEKLRENDPDQLAFVSILIKVMRFAAGKQRK